MVDLSLFLSSELMDYYELDSKEVMKIFGLSFMYGSPAANILMKAGMLLPLLCGTKGILGNGMCGKYHDFDNFVKNFVDSDYEAQLRIMMELGEQAWNAANALALD